MLREAIQATTLELENKIRENGMSRPSLVASYNLEDLHKELFDVNSMYTKNMNALQEKVSELERKKETLELDVARSNLAGEESLASLQRDNKNLETQIAQMNKDITNARDDMKAMEQIKSDWEQEKRSAAKNMLDALRTGLGSVDKVSSAALDNMRTKSILSADILSRIDHFHKSLGQSFPSDIPLHSHAERTISRIRHGLEAWLQVLNHTLTRLDEVQKQLQAVSSQQMELKWAFEAETEKSSKFSLQLQRKDTQIRDLEDAIKRQEQELGGLRTNHQQELTRAQKEVDDLRETLQRIVDEMEVNGRRWDEEKERLAKALDEANAATVASNVRVSTLQKEKVAIETQLETLQGSQGVDMNALEDLSRRNEELSDALETMRQDLIQAKAAAVEAKPLPRTNGVLPGTTNSHESVEDEEEAFEYTPSTPSKDGKETKTSSIEVQTDLEGIDEALSPQPPAALQAPPTPSKDNAKVAALEKKVSDARAYIKQQSKDLDGANERVAATEQTNKFLATELDTAQAAAKKAEERAAIAERRIEALEQQLARAKDDLHTTEASYKQQIEYMTEQMLGTAETAKES